jgi:UDP-GlcNAc:undecaprenyl-phosphate/decaprenyl-phosphate GlcNAc-1-phosphate transferase
MQYIWVAITGLVLSAIFLRFAFYFFPKWGLMDRPHKYGLKRAAIPYYGGLVIVISFLIGCAVFLQFDFKLFSFLLLATLIAMISFFDDLRGIKPVYRLLLQVGAAIGLFFSGTFVSAFPNPIGAEINLMAVEWGGVAVISLLVTVLWVILIMNTLNWIDGLNGLSSGVSGIAALVLFVLSVMPGMHVVDQSTVAIMALLLFVILAVFWIFDFYPAKILMGDTGTMFIGFILAGLAIFSGGKLATAVLVLGFPILDALWVIIRRLLEGKSPFAGDLQHFHHRLLYAGLSERQALIVIYIASAVFGLLALILGSGQKMWAVIGMISVMAVIGFAVVLMEVENNRKKG